MKSLILCFVVVFASTSAEVCSHFSLSSDEQQLSISLIQNYPSFKYPNSDYKNSNSSNGRILLFGYGSLMMKETSDGHGNPSIKSENRETSRPAIAFGVKRIFNYEEKKGFYLDARLPNEKAMLNLAPTCSLNDIVNGVLIDIDMEDLGQLVDRELGYDLVPIVVLGWEDAMSDHPEPKLQVAYTFIASSEAREGLLYTANTIYPIRGYLERVEAAAASQGPLFYEMFFETTYLADGTTKLKDWNQTFDHPLISIPGDPCSFSH